MTIRSRTGQIYEVDDNGTYRRIDAEAVQRAAMRKAGMSARQIRKARKAARREVSR